MNEVQPEERDVVPYLYLSQPRLAHALLPRRWSRTSVDWQGMDREQLIQRLRARARRGGPAEQVWWNGELLHVSEAIVRAAELTDNETIRARGDDVVIPSRLRDD